MPQISIYHRNDFAEQLKRLGQNDDVTDILQQSTPEGDRARYIHAVLSDTRGAERSVIEADAETVARLRPLADTAPNFAEAVGIVIRAAQLSAQTFRPLSFPPLLFVGPPGVGKTFFARACAKAIHTNYAEVAVNQLDDAGALVGHSLSWRGARPGLVADFARGAVGLAGDPHRRARQGGLARPRGSRRRSALAART
jgi:SpoVK/Ycf46/Vps4 family AAA+-type ATPase